MTGSTTRPPLADITVVDFSELLPGPFFTQALAEMGARVIKIERPPHGDNARRLGAGGFSAVNRGKESLLVDMKDEAQRAQVRQLVASADIVVESYRPGVMARLGMDFASLQATCPRLIYVSLSGYGQAGPWAKLPGHDINYLAAAGVGTLLIADDDVVDAPSGTALASRPSTRARANTPRKVIAAAIAVTVKAKADIGAMLLHGMGDGMQHLADGRACVGEHRHALVGVGLAHHLCGVALGTQPLAQRGRRDRQVALAHVQRIGQQQVAVAFADQAGEQVQVAAQVVGGGVGGQHEMAQAAVMAAGRPPGDGAHVAPHFIEHVLAAAGTDTGGCIGVHEQPMGGAVGAVFGADGGVGAVYGQLFDGAHGRFLGMAGPRENRWSAGRTGPLAGMLHRASRPKCKSPGRFHPGLFTFRSSASR